jgi:glycosyltransferase involved in cell wall biosynthesis
MDLSIIIPNLHSSIIDQTIQSLLDQKTDYSFEIIIIGQDKFNLTGNFISEDIFFLETEIPTPPGIARNIGASHSKGDFLFFIDADCIASQYWIDTHMSLHQKSQEPILIGGGVTFGSSNYLELVDNVSTFHENMRHIKAGKKNILPTLNMSLSRNLWGKTNGFNANPSGEDAEFTTKLFLLYDCLWFEPEAFIYHKHNRQSLSQIIKHSYRFGKYSIKGNKNFQEDLHIPIMLRNKWLTIFLSPFMSLYVIFKMLFIEKLPIKYWHTIPLIFFVKIVWCFGLAHSMVRSSKNQKG